MTGPEGTDGPRGDLGPSGPARPNHSSGPNRSSGRNDSSGPNDSGGDLEEGPVGQDRWSLDGRAESRWVVHVERTLYTSDWVSLALVDVELPDGTRIDHHVVRVPAPAVATVVVVDGSLLMMRRHRFITDTWGWEIPAGRVDAGESLADAAAREALEETGWRPGPLAHLASYHPSNGLTDQHFHIFGATDATHEGEPSDPNEAERVDWVPLDAVADLLHRGAMGDGLSFSAVSWYLAVGR